MGGREAPNTALRRSSPRRVCAIRIVCVSGDAKGTTEGVLGGCQCADIANWLRDNSEADRWSFWSGRPAADPPSTTFKARLSAPLHYCLKNFRMDSFPLGSV